MHFNFPEIKTTRNLKERVQKVQDELNEFKEATLEQHKDEELIDILHSVETLIRLRFKNREQVLNFKIREVISKNTKRGYYSKSCF